MARQRAQLEIAGAERPVHPELDEIALPLAQTRYERMDLQKQENDLADQLVERMKQLKVKAYSLYDGETEYHFKLKRGEPTIGIKRVQPKDAAADDDGDEADAA